MMGVEFYRGGGSYSDRDRSRSSSEKYNSRGRYDYRGSDEKGIYEFYPGQKNGNIRNGGMNYHKPKRKDNKSNHVQDDSVSMASLDSGGKQKSFRRLISRFADKTSMVGVPYINNAKFWRAKLIWSILLLIAIGVMSLHLWYLIDQFFQYPIQTKVSLGFSTLDFPQVTICNTNHMRMGQLQNYQGAEELRQLVNSMLPENLVPEQYDSNYDPYASQTPSKQTPGSGYSSQSPGGSGGSTQTTTKSGGGSEPPTGSGGSVQPPTKSGGSSQPPTGSGGSAQTTTKSRGSSQPPTGSGGNSKLPTRRDEFQQPTETGGSTPPPTESSSKPLKRRRRFIAENYNQLNVSSYRKKDTVNRRDFDLKDDSFYDGENDPQTELLDMFNELYMDIPKQDRARLGHNISDMLISCTFNGRICDTNMFKLHQTSEYGNCWLLSSDKFRVLSPGPNTGLTLILYLEATEYLKGITNGYGARIQVHEKGTYPFPADEGLYLPASMETDIGLKMISVSRMGDPYGHCNDGVDFQNLHKHKYTRRACQIFCDVSMVINRCKCFDENAEEIAKHKNDTLRPCRSRAEVKCMMNVYKESSTTEFCTCDNPCSEVNYVKSVSQRQWPSDDFAMVLLHDICEYHKSVCRDMRKDMDMKLISNNFLKLNIYFEDLNYESIEEDAEIEIQQFLSDVGGAIGLWIGLSMLSLCEVVQLLIELCDYGVNKTVTDRRREKKKRRKERNKKLAEEKKSSENSWPHTDFGRDHDRHKTRLYPSTDQRHFNALSAELQYGSRY